MRYCFLHTPPPTLQADAAGVVCASVCDSMVVTTQHACEALTRALPLLEPEPELRWRDITRAYVVGPQTAALVEAELPHLEVVPAGGARKASDLFDVIDGAVADKLRPALLRLHSSDRSDSLAPKLRQLHKPSGVSVRQAAVYGLSPVPISEIRARLEILGLLAPVDLSQTGQQEPQQRRPQQRLSINSDELTEEPDQTAQVSHQARCCWVVCFSPLRLTELAQICKAAEPPGGMGAESQLELQPETQDENGQPLLPFNSWMVDQATVKLVAMGPTTKAALERLGLPCAATAATPSPDGIVEAIITASSAEREKQSGDGAGVVDATGHAEPQGVSSS